LSAQTKQITKAKMWRMATMADEVLATVSPVVLVPRAEVAV